MFALMRYQLAGLGHSQRYLPPVLLFVGLLAITFSDNAGPVLPAHALTAGALLLVSTWLSVALINLEDRTQRLITLNHAGSPHRLLFASVLCSTALGIGLGVLAVVWGRSTSPAPWSAVEFGSGLLVHAICAAVGVTIGVLGSAQVFARFGPGVLATAGLAGLVLLNPWISPVHALLAAVAHDAIPPVLLGGSAVFAVAIAVLVPNAVVAANTRRR